ncbi:MAG: hypothetical protein K1X55_16585 [Chitinophagales bacterium]|nr:hypothetical protein [Chitinophagales bacterium]
MLINHPSILTTISGSLLIQSIEDTGALGMPPKAYPRLTNTQIEKIKLWVVQGMQQGIDCEANCDDTLQAKYAKDIFPIIQNNCIGCHGSSAKTILIDYNTILTQVNNGKLLCSITHSDGCLPMPQNLPQLSSCNIGRIRNWIKSGSPNN